ncbi:hypothetical protein GMOD_00003596 [Pyrenophora seminiperda CCB06]|uniref:Uncharacterized protein n=1 Tax=Pyrenophora seminiperda CCB06 TaxID=1302712 RepID=A0A3M7MJ25_9PLEO|nr:hypothetical protein GMOD_00003596 [Pyrenophora seminiperda CCB06]
MLRLRPSELTLTSDDVEETFRRIALRQATRPQSSLPPHPRGQLGRPILRRGPQRATRNAITALGKIPLLQPHQALVTSVDDDGEHTSAREDILSVDRDVSDHHHADSVTSDHERQDGSPQFPPSSASRTLQLPLRSRVESIGQSLTQDLAEHAPRTPQRQWSTSPRSGSAAESTPGLRGGGPVSRDPAHDLPPNFSLVPPPPYFSCIIPVHLYRVNLQAILPNHHTALARYFTWKDMSNQPHKATATTFVNLGEASPGGVVLVKCSLQGVDHLTGDILLILYSLPVFVAHTLVFILHRLLVVLVLLLWTLLPTRTGARSRHFGSDASVASGSYSYYGSLPPESRNPSAGNPAGGNVPDGHIDGTAGSYGSNQSSPSMTRTPPVSYGRPSTSAVRPNSGANPAHVSPFRPSPLPASPYTRPQHDQTNPSPGLALHRHILRGSIDAATAASQGLSSPLDPMAEQYQRRMQATTNRPTERSNQGRDHYYGPHAPSSSTPYAYGLHGTQSPAHYFSQYRIPVLPPYDETQPYGTQTYYGTLNQPTRASHGSSENAPVVPSFPPSHATHNSRVQEHRAAYERMQAEALEHRMLAEGLQRVHVDNSVPPEARQRMQAEALEHRVQAGNRDTPTGTTRGADMQPSRYSMPQTSIPYGRYHQDEERSTSRASTYQQRRPSPGQPELGLNANAPEFTPRLQRGSERRHPLPTRASRSRPGATHLQPTRDSPVTALALEQGRGTTSRLSRSPLIRGTMTARTHRRVPPEQRDQENDGDRSLMRREEDNINARYGEGEQQESTMNETPPRTGPVERRMHD